MGFKIATNFQNRININLPQIKTTGLPREQQLIITFIPCVLILLKFLYSPTDAQVNCLKNNFKIYIKTDITTAPTTSEQGNVHTPTRTH